MIRVEETRPGDKAWDYLVKQSRQSSLYVSSEWITLNPVKVFLALEGTSPQGGMVVAQSLTPMPFAPYQGLLLLRREDRDVALALILKSESLARPVSVWNTPYLIDIRPFTWRWYDSNVLWQHEIKYTYICQRTTELEPRCQRNLTKAPIAEVKERDGWWEAWKEQPWVTDDIERLMDKILGFSSTTVWTDGEAHVIWGQDHLGRGYYLGSVGKPTNALAELIKRHETSDLVGCNSPERALFKRGFGGALRTAYGMRLV